MNCNILILLIFMSLIVAMYYLGFKLMAKKLEEKAQEK